MQVQALLGEYRRARRRADERREADRAAGLRALGAPARDVLLRDISLGGFAVEGDPLPPVGSFVWLRVAGGMGLNARVVWREGDHCGCEFIVPIAEATYAAILAEDGCSGAAASAA